MIGGYEMVSTGSASYPGLILIFFDRETMTCACGANADKTVASGSSARSTGAAVYWAVHEDSEHRATPQSERAAGF